MKFSTYLEWSIRNIFQRAIGCRDKYVEIYRGDGTFEKTMGYGKFVEQKKALEGAGCTYTTKKRFCYLSEVLRDDDLETKLDQAGLAPYEYSTHPEASEEPPEMHETEENEESGEEKKRPRLQPVQGHATASISRQSTASTGNGPGPQGKRPRATP